MNVRFVTNRFLHLFIAALMERKSGQNHSWKKFLEMILTYQILSFVVEPSQDEAKERPIKMVEVNFCTAEILVLMCFHNQFASPPNRFRSNQSLTFPLILEKVQKDQKQTLLLGLRKKNQARYFGKKGCRISKQQMVKMIWSLKILHYQVGLRWLGLVLIQSL